jgi:hypothetical protein
MAGIKVYSMKHCNVLEEAELLTETREGVQYGIVDIGLMPPLHDPHAWLFMVARWSTAWNKASQALEVLLRPAGTASASTTWKASPGRSKPGGWGTPQ